MSKIVTPPDVINDGNVYLILNADVSDIEMVVNWLRINHKDYTIHLYQDGMADTAWLTSVAATAQHILVNRSASSAESIHALFDDINKIRWFGSGQPYDTAIQYLLKND